MTSLYKRWFDECMNLRRQSQNTLMEKLVWPESKTVNVVYGDTDSVFIVDPHVSDQSTFVSPSKAQTGLWLFKNGMYWADENKFIEFPQQYEGGYVCDAVPSTWPNCDIGNTHAAFETWYHQQVRTKKTYKFPDIERTEHAHVAFAVKQCENQRRQRKMVRLSKLSKADQERLVFSK